MYTQVNLNSKDLYYSLELLPNAKYIKEISLHIENQNNTE